MAVSRRFLRENTDARAPNLLISSPAFSKISHEFPKAFASSPKRDIFLGFAGTMLHPGPVHTKS